MKLYLYVKIVFQILISELFFLYEKKETHSINWDHLSQHSVIIYAATIGELNAAKDLIHEIIILKGQKNIILFAGQSFYMPDFQKAYSDTLVLCPDQLSPFQLNQFFKIIKPLSVFIVEGPSLYSRFPIRLSLDLPVQCLKNETPLYVVNACLYRSYLTSRFDRLQHFLFSGLHKQAITRWFVSNNTFKESLINEAIPEDRISIVGDIKFDSIFSANLKEPSSELSSILNYFLNSSIPLIVAGSIKASEEYESVIAGWLKFKSRFPNSKLVIAPRYVQEKSLMTNIKTYLIEQNTVFCNRTDGLSKIKESDVIVLDTFGELIHFYKLAALVFAGRNHGVLEPIRFDKLVMVGPEAGWDSGYPTSYYLYRYMLQHQALVQLPSYDEMANTLIKYYENIELKNKIIQNAKSVVMNQTGAVGNILSHTLGYAKSAK